MAEKTLVLLKPDAVRRGLVGKILSRFEARGFEIAAMRLTQANATQLDQHYCEHTEKEFYPAMRDYMMSGPIVALVLEGNEAVQTVRTMMGATMPQAAAPGTIRGDYGVPYQQGAVNNVIHGSDSARSATREIDIWFGPEQSA